MNKTKRESYVYEMVLAAMFAVIITICAWITIPFAVPFTMQTFGVFLAIAVLGGKLAVVSISLYILLGIIGIPVFSGFQSGIGVLFQQTGGYVIGFLIAALVSWGMENCVRIIAKSGNAIPSDEAMVSEKGLFAGMTLKKRLSVLARFIVEKKMCILAIELFLGLVFCYSFGTLWFWFLYMKNSGAISVGAVVGICVIPFVVPDVIKIGLVLVVQKRLRRMIRFGLR